MGTKSHDEEYGIKSGDKKKRGKRSKRDRERKREERAVRHEHSSRHRYESSERHGASYTPRHKSRRERDRSEDEYKKRSPRRESKYNDTDPKERKLRDHRKREKKRNHHERRKREERKENSRSRDKRRSSSSDRSKGVNRRRRADASERKMRSKSRAREQRKTNREKNRSKPRDDSTDSKRRERYSRDQKTHVPERKIIEESRDRKSDKDRNKYETQHINTQQADTSERMTPRRRRPPPPPPPRRRKGADKIDSISPRQVNQHLDVKTSSKSNTETKQTKHPGSAPNKRPITSPSSSKSKSKSSASRSSQSDDWRCSSCTTMNDYKRPFCVNCGGKYLGKDSRPKDSQAPIQKCSLDTNVLSQIQDTKGSVKKAAKENKKAPKIQDTKDNVKKAATDNKKAQKKKGILGLFSFGKKTKTSKEDYRREKPKAKEASKETRVENYPQKHLEEPLFTKASSPQRERRRNVTRKRTDSRGSSKSSNSSTCKATKKTSGETKRITTSALNKRVLSDMSCCGTDLESPKPQQVSNGHSSKLSSKSVEQTIPRSAKNIPNSALSGGVLSDISSGTHALKSSIPNKKQTARENSKLAPDKKKKSNRPARNSIPVSALSRGVLSDISSGMQTLKNPVLDHTPKEKNATTLTTEPKPEAEKSSGLSSSEDKRRSALSKGLLSDISSGTKVLKQSKDAPEQNKKTKANKPLSLISQIQSGKALKSVNDRKNAEQPKPKRPISVLDQIKAPPRPLKKVERITNEETEASSSANGNGNNTAIESIIARRQFYGSNRSSSNMASDRSGYDSEEWD